MKKDGNLLERISDWTEWKLDALMLDETDIKIREEIERRKSEKRVERILEEQELME